MSKLEPAYSVIRKFDRKDKRGSFVLAERLGLNDSAVRKWALSRERSGTGGYIPPRYYDKILAFADELGVELDEREFVKKSEDTEIAA